MNFEPSELHRTLRDEAKRFAEQTLQPKAEAIDEPAGDAVAEPLLAQAAELGFLGLLAPEAKGGAELDALAYALVVEALAAGSPSVARVVANHAGPATAALAAVGKLSEAHVAGESIAFAHGLAPRPASLVASDAGVHETWQAEPVDGLGHRGARLCRFELGEPEWTLSEADAVRALALHELGLAALALGSGRYAYRVALAYAGERRQFSRPIAAFQAIQWKLADSETQLAAATELVQRAALSGTPADASAARVMAYRAGILATDHAIQIHGGYGYTREYPVERHYRSVKMCGAGLDASRSRVAGAVLA
ncbi:MAG: acyl-CoA dehydrogenase family protein [Myxococcota bacterium]